MEDATEDAVTGRWLNAREAADRAGVSLDTVYKAVNRRQLKHTRISGKRVLKFQAVWIDQWLTQSAVEPTKGDRDDGTLQTV